MIGGVGGGFWDLDMDRRASVYVKEWAQVVGSGKGVGIVCMYVRIAMRCSTISAVMRDARGMALARAAMLGFHYVVIEYESVDFHTKQRNRNNYD